MGPYQEARRSTAGYHQQRQGRLRTCKQSGHDVGRRLRPQREDTARDGSAVSCRFSCPAQTPTRGPKASRFPSPPRNATALNGAVGDMKVSPFANN